jgi:uncharacterized protein YndB with AHSA1/START domain
MTTVSAATWIDAPPEAVWAVLTDLARYPEWNPLFTAATGDLAAGRRITLHRADGDGPRHPVRARVTAVTPAAELSWVYRAAGMPPGLTTVYNCTLKPGNGGTLVLQHEAVHGFLKRFSRGGQDQAEDGFRALNGALKARVESSGPDFSANSQLRTGPRDS